MNMQLGISSFAYGWATTYPQAAFTEHTLLDRAAARGVRLVQFGDNLPLHELPAKRLAILKQRADKERFMIEIGARGLTEAHLHRYVSLARQLGSKLLRFVVDAAPYEPPVDTLVGLLREAVPTLTDAGLTLGLENHDRLTARHYADIVERVGSPQVGICLDSVNSVGAGEGLAEVVGTLAPYTVNLHLKDFGIRRLPHLMGFQVDGRPAGAGMLNVPWLVAQLQPHGRCHTAVLEQWVVPEADPAATILKEAAWAEQSMTYLKQTGLFRADGNADFF
jgi:3-oxoisoapionate decarboxylase